ncbi:LpxL/LpxP family acyltransferase [Hydrogenovibrio halophilus]|uniref:LpxL/LpxP family acyltransferase n=1 Tax=Hydrogenovibrio halophilus TaxID=373391 RepID=UPI000379B45D|nr:hypothetical protein [Hydrogenovibrio halophilus]
MSQNWTEQKERSNRFWLTLIRRLALTLPRWLVKPLLYPIVAFYWLISPLQRQASRHYLSRVLAQPVRPWHTYRHFLWFAITILDRVYFLTGRWSAFDVSYEHLAEYKAATRKTAHLLLGAHFGSLDATRTLSQDRHDRPIKVVLKVDQNAQLVALLNELNPGMENNVLPYRGMETIFDIYQTLQDGQSVAMLKDRPVGDETTVPVTFFGDTLCLPISGFKLAKRFRIPCMVFFGRYQGGNRYRVSSEILPFTPDMSLQQMAQLYMDKVAEQCQQAPYNWFNFYPYWSGPCSDTDANAMSVKGSLEERP